MDALSSTLPSVLALPAEPVPSVLRRPLPRTTVAVALAVIALNLVDAFGTLRHVAMGAEEINPLMAWLLEQGPLTFFVGKHLLAGAGVIGILAQGDVRPARLVLRYVLLPIYLAVAIYQIALFGVV